VHFTQAGLTWVCKTVQCDEREGVMDVEQYPEWVSVLSSYTERELIYETDRLIALEGLVKEMQKATTEKYCLGIWTSGLPEHLLWMICDRHPMKKPLDLPSWSWATKPGPKDFLISMHDLDGCRKRTCGQISFKYNNTVEVHGGLKKCKISTHEAGANGFPQRGYGFFLKKLMREQGEAIHYIQDTEKQSEAIIGLATLDGDSCHDLFCLFLTSTDWEHPFSSWFVGIFPEYSDLMSTQQLHKGVSLSIRHRRLVEEIPAQVSY
jgi:hypothetical protein